MKRCCKRAVQKVNEYKLRMKGGRRKKSYGKTL